MLTLTKIIRAIRERKFEGEFFTDSAAEKVPKGSFHAPSFMLDSPENHDGMGYHSHLLCLHRTGGYKRSGYLFTLDPEYVWCVEHGGVKLFDAQARINAIRKDIHEQIKDDLMNKAPYLRISPKDIASGKAFRVFSLG